MATQQDVEYNELLLNACVLLMACDSNNDPLLQPRSLGIAKRGTRVRLRQLLWGGVVAQNHPRTVLKSPNRTEDYPLDYPYPFKSFA